VELLDNFRRSIFKSNHPRLANAVDNRLEKIAERRPPLGSAVIFRTKVQLDFRIAEKVATDKRIGDTNVHTRRRFGANLLDRLEYPRQFSNFSVNRERNGRRLLFHSPQKSVPVGAVRIANVKIAKSAVGLQILKNLGEFARHFLQLAPISGDQRFPSFPRVCKGDACSKVAFWRSTPSKSRECARG
jgi:hypothetical protein